MLTHLLHRNFSKFLVQGDEVKWFGARTEPVSLATDQLQHRCLLLIYLSVCARIGNREDVEGHILIFLQKSAPRRHGQNVVSSLAKIKMKRLEAMNPTSSHSKAPFHFHAFLRLRANTTWKLLEVRLPLILEGLKSAILARVMAQGELPPF